MPIKDFLPFPIGGTASASDTKIAGPNGLVSVLPTTTGTFTEATPFRKDLATLMPREIIDLPLGNTTLAANVGTTANKYLTPGTYQPVRLRAVQAGAAITTTCIGQLVSFVTTASQFGVVVAATTAQGAVAKPIHGAYPVGKVFAAYDWFWVVEEGPAIVTVANGQTIAAHGPVECYDTSGHVGPGLAGHAIVGTSDVAVSGSINGTTSANLAVVYVKAGTQTEEGAG